MADKKIRRAIVFLALALLLVAAYVIQYGLAGARHGPILNASYQRHIDVARAIRKYEEEHGHLPPVYLTDNAGNPIHSWRVLILPFLGYQDLFDQYSFDESWNGPNNKKLANHIPVQYHSDQIPYVKPHNMTSMLAVSGPNTTWPLNSNASSRGIADGHDTILLLEFVTHPVHWMSPEDLDINDVFKPNNELAISPSSQRESNAFVASFVDGFTKVYWEMAPNTLHALLTTDGGEEVRFNSDAK